MALFLVVSHGRLVLYSFFLILLLVLISALGILWSGTAEPPPIVAMPIDSPDLAYDILGDVPIAELRLLDAEENTELLLKERVIDYYISTVPFSGQLRQSHVGTVVAAVVVSYFDETEPLSIDDILRRIHETPGDVLISNKLALEGLPWFGKNIRYWPTDRIVESVANNEGIIGIIPLQDRIPSLRVLAVDGWAPSEQNVLSGNYPLQCPLILYRRSATSLELFQERLARRGKPSLFQDYLKSKLNHYYIQK